VSLRSSSHKFLSRNAPFWNNKLSSVNKFKYVSIYMIFHVVAFKVRLWRVDSKRNLLYSAVDLNVIISYTFINDLSIIIVVIM
jgi:hypothetical protein